MDIRAFTAELIVRYHAPVISTEAMDITARLENARHGLFQLRAEILQAGTLKAQATGKFMSHD